MADVTIDGTISTSTARGMRATTFLRTDNQTGYFFYIDSGGTFVYSKTTDGGATWGAAVTVKSATTNVAYDIWPDWWTPGDSGTLIHCWYFDTTNDDVFYRSLDTATDTLGTERTVFNGASSVAGRGAFCSGTKTKSGYLYVAYDIDAGAEKGLHRSTDGGTTWSASLSSTFVEATIDQCQAFPASGTGDDNDAWFLYQDASANAVTLKLWDSSAASATESATIATLAEATTDLTGQYGFSGAIRHSDGHLIFLNRVQGLGAAGAFECYDVTSTSTWTKLTNLAASLDDNYYPSMFVDQTTDDLYAAYIGKLDGSEAVGTGAKVWYVKSTDDGTTWSANQAYMDTAANASRQTWAPLSGSRFYAGWRNTSTTLLGNAVNSVGFTVGGGGGGFTLTPDVGSLALTGFAPTFPRTIIPGFGQLTLTGLAPTFPVQITPGTGQLILTGLAPTFTSGASVTVTPGTGSLILDGFAPVFPRTIIPNTGQLILDGFSPTFPRTLVLAAGQLTLTGFQPSFPTGGGPTPLALQFIYPI